MQQTNEVHNTFKPIYGVRNIERVKHINVTESM